MAVMIKKVGVIGSGQMGNGIAHVAALAGFDVVLNDVTTDRLKSGMATINGNLSRQVAKKFITEEARKQAVARIALADSMEGLADCDLVIETAVEKEDVKSKTKDLSRRLLAVETERHRRLQHVLDFDHAAGGLDRPARALHRHSLHESGAADGIGRADPRHRHGRYDL